MSKLKRLLALILSLMLVVSCAPLPTLTGSAVTPPTMVNNADIGPYVTDVLTYFTKDNLATYQAWLTSLQTEADTYAAAIARLEKGIAKLNEGYAFYDDGTLLGNYAAQYEPTYHAERVTYYTTVTNPSGSIITLHKEAWDEVITEATGSAGTTAVYWNAENLTNVTVERADTVDGTRTPVANGELFAVSGNIVLFFTVTPNKDNANKPEFLGAKVGETTYSRQAMLIEDYKMAPYKLNQADADKNMNSAYQVVWGGLETTRGDTTWAQTSFGYDYPFEILLGKGQSNPNLTIKSFNTNGIRVYGQNDTNASYNQNTANSYSATLKLTHQSNNLVNHTLAKAAGIEKMVAQSGNWITLADANTYSKYWGADSDVAQIIPAGETISEFAVDTNIYYAPVIIYDYVDAYNYSYIFFNATAGNPTFNKVTVKNGAESSNGTLQSYQSGNTKVEGTDYYWAGFKLVMGDGYNESLKFVWNDETNCYDLKMQWPLVAEANKNFEPNTASTNIKGYAERTFSLGSTSGAQLTNIYLSNHYTAYSRIMDEKNKEFVSNTIQQFGAIAVKTQGHDHHYVAYTGAANSELEITPKTCYSYAVYYGVCSICGKSSKGETEPATFDYAVGGYAEHTWSTAHNYNATHHWQECTVCAQHDKVSSTTPELHNQNGENGACDVCGFNTGLNAVKEQILAVPYFQKTELSSYTTMMQQLEAVKDVAHYQEAYNRISKAVSMLNSGFTFYDDMNHVATYKTEASQPAETGEQTYYITVVNPAGQAITLFKETFTEAVTTGTPGAGNTAVYWDATNLNATVQYSADGGVTKLPVTNGTEFAAGDSIILYITLTAEGSQRKFVGFKLGDTVVYRQEMFLTTGVHAPYKLDPTADSSKSPYQVIWGGFEATRYTSNTGDKFYDYPNAIVFDEEKGVLLTALGGLKGAYVGNTNGSNAGYPNKVMITCSDNWGESENKLTNSNFVNMVNTRNNWLTLADKAGYDAYYGGDNDVMQIIPEGQTLNAFTVSLDTRSYARIIYQYTDAYNYRYVQFESDMNNPIKAYKVVNGVATNLGTLWNQRTVAISSGEFADNWYASSRVFTYANSIQTNTTLSFTWNKENNCYELTIENWPVANVSSIYGDGGWTSEAAGYAESIVGYAPRTVSLKNFTDTATAMRLSNIFVGGQNNGNLNATTAIYGVAVAPVDQEHVCAPKDSVWHSDGASHYQLCECGQRVNEAACTAGGDYITENGQHYKNCTECGNKVTATQGNCTAGDRIHDGTHHYTSCTTCGALVGEKEECVSKDGYQQENGQHWIEYQCGVAMEKTDCSGDTVVPNTQNTHSKICDVCKYSYGDSIPCTGTGDWQHENGEHWKLCECGNTTDKANCAAAENAYEKSAEEHWQLCATCGTEIAGSRVEHTYVPNTATYEKGNLCVCGHDDGQKVSLPAPAILGSKILKAPAATDQRLRIYIDFTDILKALEGEENVTYGAIVAPMNETCMTDPTKWDTFSKEMLIEKGINVVSSATVDSTGRIIMRLTIGMSYADYGKRVAVIGYVKVGDLTIYTTGNKESIGLEDGVIKTGVMRVMKAVLADEVNGYATKIDTAAYAYFSNAEEYKLTGYNSYEEVAELVKKYAAGEITTSDGQKYNDAKEAAMYIYYHCTQI